MHVWHALFFSFLIMSNIKSVSSYTKGRTKFIKIICDNPNDLASNLTFDLNVKWLEHKSYHIWYDWFSFVVPIGYECVTSDFWLEVFRSDEKISDLEFNTVINSALLNWYI